MNTRRNTQRVGVSALTIAILAGAPASATAQNSSSPVQAHRSASTTRVNAGYFHFVKSSAFTGADVVNRNDETIGTVTDLIIDRGSGELTQALIESGAILGIGGKTIAVPFSRLQWDDADEQFVLDMTQEQIDRAVEFDPNAWPNLDHTTWSERVDRWWNGTDDSKGADYGRDPWAKSLSKARAESLEGTIIDVRRERLGDNEQVIVVVRAQSGERRELVLGPSWFVMGSKAAPMRGDSINAKYATISPDGKSRLVVISANIDGEQLNLRDSEGLASWNLPTSPRPDNQHANGRLILISDLVGAKASSASDTEAGEIQNVVLERHSARVAMLGFDPNEAFLGLGDEIKCVPWSIANVAPDGTVRIDATDEALSNCEAMPEDLTAFRNESNLRPVYAVFAVPVDRFEPRATDDRRSQRRNGESPDAQSRDKAFFEHFAKGQKIELEGEIEAITSRSLGYYAPVLRIIKISTDMGSREIVIGPEWYMANQDMPLRQGDRVSVTARKASVEGKTYYAATSITTPDREFAVWNGSEPVWNDG